MANTESCPRETVPETKDRILEAALTVFGEKGYHNATMAEIAEAAAVGKGTLYWHFSSKEELFSGMVDHGIGLLEQRLHAIIIDERLSFPCLFKRITRKYLEFAYNHRHLARIFLNSIHGGSGELQERFLQLHARFNRVNTEIIRRGLRENFLRPDLELDKAETALSGLFSAFIGRQILIDQDQQFEAETRFIFDLFVKGIGTN